MIVTTSETWITVEKYCNEQLELYRTKLERKSANMEDTQLYRGRVAMLRNILKLPEQDNENG